MDFWKHFTGTLLGAVLVVTGLYYPPAGPFLIPVGAALLSASNLWKALGVRKSNPPATP